MNDDDDLAELEKRLTEKAQQTAGAQSSAPSSPSRLTFESDGTASPRSSVTSPGFQKDKDRRQDDKHKPIATPVSLQGEEEVEALSEMMCSLVTNNCGETRYIGNRHSLLICVQCSFCWICLTNKAQAPRPASPSSHPRASSGSTTRRAMPPSRT